MSTTPQLRCCESTKDDRGMAWAEMCPDDSGSLIQNKTDGCPPGTKGFAFWTCNPLSGTFSPPQVQQ